MLKEYTLQDRQVTAQPGEEFSVKLEANPTTGYLWEAEFDHALLRLIDQQFTLGGQGFGSGGIDRFRFETLTAGNCKLLMKYKRPLESMSVEEVVFDVHITPGR